MTTVARPGPTDPAAGGTRRLLAGVDVGGSKIAALVTDADLQPLGRFREPWPIGDPAEAPAAIERAVDAALADAGATREQLAAVGVGVPGRVDPARGVVTLAVNLGWTDLDLGPRLAERLGVPVVLENDVRSAAAGLFQRGVLGPVRDLAYLGIGTGISAGVIVDGRLMRGPRGMAGEIGHVVIEPSGPLCACGLRGCFEALAAGPAVARRAMELLAAGRTSALRAIAEPTAADVFEAADAGDAMALEIVGAVGRYVARAVHELVMAWDVDVVVLGGGVVGAGDAFLQPVLRALDGLRAASPLARELLRPGVVHLLPADADAGAWGAVVLAAGAIAGTTADPLPGPTAAGGREVGDG
jgi:glucokinase